MDEASIFAAALEKKTPQERAAFLDGVCAADPKLRASVESLLQADEDAGEFLEPGVADVPPTIDHPIAEQPGTQIGPYKLLQEIGHGGMGVVYMAEQKEPVKRRVALKIIKPGMDSRQVIARFEAERQALAMMDHPNIAKVLDAGTTDSGRPYFVMELVNGVRITDYCDEQHLTPRERLELLVPVCQAVQHAHQKGIIHRDLKPSNILIALYDGQAVPKVIDFGVAKATSQTLTDKTLFTQLGQVVGTLEYMSPEQAQRNQLDVDTRSDIYSLGVVLYELLTGTTPFEKERLRNAAIDEVLRIIREEEPQRPSLRLSSIETLPSVAANRHTEPQKLRSLVRGELDWIVMTALEKDRARRYATANGFADDIQRYLNNDTVEACPPSAAYRFRKFARRNRGSVGYAYKRLSLLKEAESTLQRALQLRRDVFGNEHEKVAECLRTLSRATNDITLAREALRIQRNLGSHNESLCKTLTWMCGHLTVAGRFEEAEPYGREALEILRGFRGKADALVTAQAQAQLAGSLRGQRRFEDAISLWKAALVNYRQLSNTFPAVGYAQLGIAKCYMALGDYGEAESHARKSLAVFQSCALPGTKIYAEQMLATVLETQGHFREAEATLGEMEQTYRRLNHDSSVAWTLFDWAAIRFSQGDWTIVKSKYPEIVNWPREDGWLSRGRATYRVAKMLQHNGNTAEADKYFHRLRTAFKFEESGKNGELTFKEQTALTLYLLAVVNLSGSQRGDLERAIQFVESA